MYAQHDDLYICNICTVTTVISGIQYSDMTLSEIRTTKTTVKSKTTSYELMTTVAQRNIMAFQITILLLHN